MVTLAERYGGVTVTRATFEAMIAEVAAHVDRFAAEHWHAAASARIHLLGTSGTVTTIAGVHLELQALRPPPRRRLLDERRAGRRGGRAAASP